MNIQSYIKAAYPGIAIITAEETRAESMLAQIAQEEDFRLFSWTLTNGMVDAINGGAISVDTAGNPIAPLDEVKSLPERSILLLKDYQFFVDDPTVIRKLKDTLSLCEQTRKCIVLLGVRIKLPPELEREIVVESMPMPTASELEAVLEGISKSAGVDVGDGKQAVLKAASGMTTTEAKNAFAKAFIDSGKSGIPHEIVAREKCAAINKGGLLTVVDSNVGLDQVGGLERMKGYLMSIRDNFTEEAMTYGLEPPAPMMVIGQPGTGKTLVSHCIGPTFKVPVLRLDASRLMASHVGETEGNWRKVVQIIRAVAPCGFHIDEIDGAVGAVDKSGSTDGGVKAGLVKQMLQDIQAFQTERVPVLCYFTANDIDGMPDPLIDRCNVWSVELPHSAERKAIWSIQIAKRKRDPSQYNIEAFATATEGFSGRQIERVWMSAMQAAFNDCRREPTDGDVLAQVKATTPTSQTMSDAINRRRQRLQGRAQAASEEMVVAKTTRKF